MGWTGYIATHYRNGKIDKKAELDSLFTWNDEKKTVSVLKSSLIGNNDKN